MSASKQYTPKAEASQATTRYAAVPQALKDHKQWVAWKYVHNPKRRKPEKRPINPRTGKAADTTDATTWGTFAEAVARCQRDHLDGIGFALTAVDPFAGIDLDHCRNPETEEIATWAQTAIQALSSYTETSPSVTGVRIFVFGKLPPIGRKKGDIEVYEAGRYLTITGYHLPGTPHTIEDRQAELTTWHASIWTLRQAKSARINDVGELHVNTAAGVLACNSSPISLKDRFQSVDAHDGL
jgi:primase-polymerase (primpol)-like protein